MIDSHTHLEFCEPPDAELVAAAAAAGVTRMLTVGTDGASCRAALAAAEDFPQVYAAIGRHPNEATGFDDADLAELEALARITRSASRSARPGSTTTATTRPARIRSGPSEPRSSSRADRQAARDPHPRRRRRHARDARSEAGGIRVILHCFSMADRIEECLAHEDWWISFAGNVTYPKAPDLRTAACGFPRSGCWSRPTRRTCLRRRCAARPNQPAHVVHTARAWRSSAGSPTTSSTAQVERRGRGGVRMVSGKRGRARQHELGQNFLVDRNILDVIERLAEVGRQGRRARDRRRTGRAVGAARRACRAPARGRGRPAPRGAPAGALAGIANVTLHIGDALELDLARSAGADKVVANLPYGIAATAILRTIDELPEPPSGS